MAQIKAMYRGDLTQGMGMREEQLQAAMVSDILSHIKAKQGKDVYKRAKAMLIVVNGISILHLDLYKTKLSDGDTVSFLPLAAGG